MQTAPIYIYVSVFIFFTEIFILCDMMILLIARKSRNWVETNGELTVMDVADRPSLFGGSLRVIREIQYQYKLRDKMYIGHRIYPFGFGPVGRETKMILREMPAVGEQLKVYFDPQNPHRSSLVNKMPYGLLTLFGVVALVGLGATSFALVAYQLDVLRVVEISLIAIVPASLTGLVTYKAPEWLIPGKRLDKVGS